MGPLPQLQVTVDAKGWSCILDMRLALDRRGPMFALRLAEELRVFLVPSLWQVLDNTTFYDRHPGRLYGDPLDCGESSPGAVAPVLDNGGALTQWETARLELGLSALRVYWAGDAVHESSLPKDVDPGVVTRFERLAETLSRRMTNAHPDLETGWPLLEGARDASALAMALARYRPVIFTLGGDGEPALIHLLRSCNIHCQALDTGQALHQRNYLAPLLARCGGLELTWAGLPIVAVHLVAPAAFLMSPVSEDVDEPTVLGQIDTDWLQGATAHWYPLS